MEETSAVLGGILSIIHPGLFEAGMQCMEILQENPDFVAKNERLAEIMEIWSSPFTGLSVMNNRQTPLHRDNGGGHKWLDMLASVGPYIAGRLHLPGLGYELRYESGTVVGVTGRMVLHGAHANGQRACFAYYFRENVVKALGVSSPKWAKIHRDGPK